MLNQQLILGSVYRVKFKGVFERHGVCTTSGLTCLHKGNGVFRLEAITTFRTLVLSGVKLYDTFFAPLGITQEEYDQYYSDKPADKYSPVYAVQEVKETDTQQEWAQEKETGKLVPIKKTVTITNEKFVETGESVLAKYARDSVNFSAYPIYKFVDVVDPDDIVYAPALTIDGFPEIEISEYQDLSLVFRLGYFDDPTKLDPMLLAIRERMAAYGIKPKLIKLYSTGSKYLNPDEYEKLRSVRLPAKVEQIPEGALFSDYADKKVIMTNKILSIVENDAAVQDPDTQISFASLKAHHVVLDRQIYSAEIDANELYNGASTYYELLTRATGETFDTYRVLPTGPVGGRVMRLASREYTAADAAAKRPAFVAMPEAYVQLAFNEPRSTSLYIRETTDTRRDEISVDIITEFRHPTSAELDDGNLVLYRKVSGMYESALGQHATRDTMFKDEKDYYVANDNGTYTKLIKGTDYSVNDSITQYAAAHGIVYENYDYSDLVGGTYYVSESQTESRGTGIIFRDDFASSNILKIVGNNFKYGTSTSDTQTVTTMTTTDIINFAQGKEVEGIEIFIQGEDATNQARCAMYGGRLFSTEINVDGVTVPVEIVIPDEPDAKLAGLTGDILGQYGIVSRDTYILDNDPLGRNYYIQYLQVKQENDALRARNAALEEIIKEHQLPREEN